MHWSCEWAEQLYDVSSPSSSPLPSKPPPNPQTSGHAYPGLARVADDISTHSASSLLMHYAERYSSTSAYPEPGAFLGGVPAQDARSLRYGADGMLGTSHPLTELQCSSGGPSCHSSPAGYSCTHAQVKPANVSQIAFPLPPCYGPAAPEHSQPHQGSSLSAPGRTLTPLAPPSFPLPTSMPLSLHSSQRVGHEGLLYHSEELRELPYYRKFGFDQSKTARLLPYEIKDKAEGHGSSSNAGGQLGSRGADFQSYHPEMLSSEPNLRVGGEGEARSRQPFVPSTLRGPEHFSSQ